MKAIFNNSIIQGNTFSLEINDRAFQYGDSIFETAKYINGKIPLLDYHYERLQKSSVLLGYELPGYFNVEFLQEKTEQIVTLNNLRNPAKIKIRIWRKPGGNYTPKNNLVNFLIIGENLPLDYKKRLTRIGFANSIRNNFSHWSYLKTGNALNYILAGIEKTEGDFDDLIILDNQEHISEMIQSNIIWIKNGIFFTPSLQSGCIKGVMRSFLQDLLEKKGNNLKQGLFLKKDLMAADYVLSCNAMGIVSVEKIEEISFPVFPSIKKINPYNS